MWTKADWESYDINYPERRSRIYTMKDMLMFED
jgi:hypothetical protein